MCFYTFAIRGSYVARTQTQNLNSYKPILIHQPNDQPTNRHTQWKDRRSSEKKKKHTTVRCEMCTVQNICSTSIVHARPLTATAPSQLYRLQRRLISTRPAQTINFHRPKNVHRQTDIRRVFGATREQACSCSHRESKRVYTHTNTQKRWTPNCARVHHASNAFGRPAVPAARPGMLCWVLRLELLSFHNVFSKEIKYKG